MSNPIYSAINKHQTTINLLWHLGIIGGIITLLVHEANSKDQPSFLWVKSAGVETSLVFFFFLFASFLMAMSITFQLIAAKTSDKQLKGECEVAEKVASCAGAISMLAAILWAFTYGFLPKPSFNPPEGTYEVGMFCALWGGFAATAILTFAWNFRDCILQAEPSPTNTAGSTTQPLLR